MAWSSADAGGQELICIRDLSVQKESTPLLHSNRVVSLAFSPDIKALATLDLEGTVRIWNLGSREILTQLPTKGRRLWLDQHLVDTTVPATLSADRTARRRQARFGGSAVFANHYGCVLFSPDGRWLAVGEASPQIRLLDRTTGTERIIQMPPPADGISALAWSPDSQLLAVGCGGGITTFMSGTSRRRGTHG